MITKINYNELFRKGPGLIMLLQPNESFTILDASDLYLEATRTKRSEIVGRGLFEVFPDNPDEAGATGVSNLRRSLHRAIGGKVKDTMQLQKYDVITPGGFEEKYWLPRNIPVLDANGEVDYIIHHVDDVTEKTILEHTWEKERREAAEEIDRKSRFIQENGERINRILSALLKYTTMDFSDRLSLSDKGDELDAIAAGLNSLIDELESHTHMLNQVNAALEYSNKELDSFSYSVSHDLRAPLRAINGYSQMLLEDYAGKLDDEGQHVIHVIIKNAAKMGALIDDLLTFSRVGKQSMTRVPLNLDSIVNSVIREITANYTGNPITWNVKPLINFEGDGSMIAQVMTNLISNAVKYSGKKDTPTVEIGSTEKDGMITYYVKDNGAGFDMKYYDKLFGVFQRLHSASEFEGTGVGLALVQRIIKKHQGEVWAEAEPDKGATFFFTIPITH